MTRSNIKLPRTTLIFLRTPSGQQNESMVLFFHKWLNQRTLNIVDLTPSHIDNFLGCPSKISIASTTKDSYRRKLVKYLEWLFSKGHLLFDPKCFSAHPKRLPSIAVNFIESLEVTLKPSTCAEYRSHLRTFHNWTDENAISVKRIKRQHVTRWFKHLKDRGIHPATRSKRIICIRVYLRWLHDQGILRKDPDNLIGRADFPKLPTYLPRPLPPVADHQLQIRLANSHCLYQQGLLLMRYTGLRIGELMSLEQNCIRTDYQGNNFLKVPLGKFNNERLVPLDDKIVKLIEKLQCKGSRHRTWLLEKHQGKKTRYFDYRRVLHEACKGLEIDGKMTSHRLRHSYATALLNGGMSLVGVMNLLGHRDYRMTLRYTAITQETVGKEYFEALAQIEKKYSADFFLSRISSETDPIKLLSDVTHLIQKQSTSDNLKKQAARSLIKRIQRIQNALKTLLP